MWSFLQFISSKFCLFHFFASSKVGQIVKSVSSAIYKLFRTRLKKKQAKKQKSIQNFEKKIGEFEYFGGSDVANKLLFLFSKFQSWLWTHQWNFGPLNFKINGLFMHKRPFWKLIVKNKHFCTPASKGWYNHCV